MKHIDESSQEEVAKRLEWLRQYRNLSKTTFATSLGVGKNTYGNWTAPGGQRLSLPAAINICRRYRVTLDFLYLGKIDGLPKDLFDSWVKHNSEQTDSRA